jgi:hypothetical protein
MAEPSSNLCGAGCLRRSIRSSRARDPPLFAARKARPCTSAVRVVPLVAWPYRERSKCPQSDTAGHDRRGLFAQEKAPPKRGQLGQRGWRKYRPAAFKFIPKYVRPMASKKSPAEAGQWLRPIPIWRANRRSNNAGRDHVFRGRSLVLPVPASSECVHGGLARLLKAVRRIAPFMEGRIDRPYPTTPRGLTLAPYERLAHVPSS